MTRPAPHVAIVGAGIGGLAAALRLAYGGARVTVFERHAHPGGKMRTLPSLAGPVDAGPTVLTLRHHFEALFAETGSRLSDHITLEAEPTLARHFWPDGTRLDLMADGEASAANIARTFGARAARAFRRFDARAEALFRAFDGPMMQAAAPSLPALVARVMRDPRLLLAMQPQRSLADSLSHTFTEPKLAQLFGRYATYVGGLPQATPALLALIWRAEARGVWQVRGGMQALARAIQERAVELGAEFHFGCPVDAIETDGRGVTALSSPRGRLAVDAILFNGDPRGLSRGLLGPGAADAVPPSATQERSLSAFVHAFAARAAGPELAAHNVFFCADPAQEFGPLAHGRAPEDATVYICAQDRFGGRRPAGPERLEMIVNAPPCAEGAAPTEEERSQCHSATLARLARFGLSFSPPPGPERLTLPQDFAELFPGSNGALYGLSPRGMMAPFRRPTARSRIPGLYLAGGGVHPGPGVPMAALSGSHAAATMLRDLSSTSRSRPAATPGGTSTGSPTMEVAPSRSSAS